MSDFSSVPALLRRLGLLAAVSTATLLGACASAPPAQEPAVRMELGLPLVQSTLSPATYAHLDGEPRPAAEATP